MDFQVTQTSRYVLGVFKFVAISDAAKRYVADLTGQDTLSFSREVQDFMPAVKDILYHNLTIQIQ